MDKRVFKVYINGDDKVVAEVTGEDALDRALEEAARTHPNSMVVVKEVHESIVQIHLSEEGGEITKLV
jgi:hypothetical protein